jgi:RNA polymerase sigma factor (sigma-70 family)
MSRPVTVQDDEGVDGVVDPAATPRSFEAFYESERDRLYGAMCLLTADRHEAEEIVQEAFLVLWGRWDRREAIRDPVAYLYRTAMNTFRTRLRRRRLSLRKTEPARESPDPLSVAEAHRTLFDALSTLPPRQRQAVVLTELLDCSSEEAGRVMGVKAATVRALAHQGRASLHRVLEDRDD